MAGVDIENTFCSGGQFGPVFVSAVVPGQTIYEHISNVDIEHRRIVNYAIKIPAVPC